MTRNRARPTRVLGSLGTTLLLALLWCSASQAQFNGDPFDPYRAAFQTSSFPTYNRTGPTGSARFVAPPGMGTVPGIGDPGNRFAPLSELEGSRFAEPGLFDPGLFTPGTAEYRQYDEDFGRIYRPNAGADASYQESKQLRDAYFLRAMNATDPEERAEYLRKYREANRQLSLALSPSFARRSQTSRPPDLPGLDRPTNRRVESYDDLLRWSRRIDQMALRNASSVEAESPSN